MFRDAGAETSSNYRFQHLYTALLGIQMYNQKIDFTELICEIDNDIIAKDRLGNITAYQITRTDSLDSVPQKKIEESISHFMKQCNEQKHKAFCLVANQKIGNIARNVNEMCYLSDEQIAKYCKKLNIEETEESKACFKKICFMVIQDLLGLEYLMNKELLYSFPEISDGRLNCIKERLIGLAEKCSRSSEKESSPFYTIANGVKRKELKMQSRTIGVCNIKNIINICFETKDARVENIVSHKDSLMENDEQLLAQFINEASDED
jgi:hypothetical protein